jgi:hypothetical protein
MTAQGGEGKMRTLKRVLLGSLLLLIGLGSPLASLGRGAPTINPAGLETIPSELPFTGGSVTVRAEIDPTTVSSGGCGCSSDSSLPVVQAWLTVNPAVIGPTDMTLTQGNVWETQISLPGNSTTKDIQYVFTVRATDDDGMAADPVWVSFYVRASGSPPDEPL